ncbi:hypothetical protein ABK040_016450 [Willaertia magna]
MIQIIEKELDNLYEIEDGEQFCYRLGNDIVRLSLELIEDKYFDEKSISYSVEKSIDSMFCILDYIFIQKDDGRNDQHLSPGHEPERVPIDSFARGSVPIRKAEKNKPQLNPNLNKTNISTSTVRSYRSRSLKQ